MYHSLNFELEKATDSEKLIWDNINKDVHCPSNVLTYNFSINVLINIDEVQKAIYFLLTKIYPELTNRFLEIDSILYKQQQVPSLNPVTFVLDTNVPKKKYFDKNSSCLYYFEWQQTNKGGILFVNLSHLIFDGQCYEDFCNALTQAFDDNYSEKIPIIDPYLNEMNQECHKYWQEELEGKPVYQPLIFLPKIVNSKYISVRWNVDNNLYLRLKEFTKEHNVTLFQTITAALAILIHTYSANEEGEISDLVLSYCLSQRQVHQAIGCYLKILPLYLQCKGEDSALQILEGIRKKRQQHRVFQNISLESLLSKIDEQVNRHQSLFNVVINHSPGLLPLNGPIIKGKESYVTAIDSYSGKRCLSVVYNFNDTEMIIQLETNRGEFVTELLNQLAKNLEKTLKFMVETPNISISNLNFSFPPQPHSVGRVTNILDKNIIEQIDLMSKRFSNKVAIQSQENSVSYRELMNGIEFLSKKLRNINKDTLKNGIGIYLSREYYLPLVMLSCVYESIMFVPLAIELPHQSIKEIIDSTNISIIIVDDITVSLIQNENIEFIHINASTFKNIETAPPLETYQPNLIQDIAYTLFTSGSSGKPKGVMITYRNLFNFLSSMAFNPGLTCEDCFLAMTPVSFDISITELLLPLFCGASLVITDEHSRRNAENLAKLINDYHVTTVQATPSSFMLLKDNKWISSKPLSLWIGGEPLPLNLIKYLLKQGHRIFNMYGPTETTIWASTTAVESTLPIMIGTAVDNSALYILDENGNRPPMGKPGQLFITGECVGKGYSNHNSESFITTSDGVKGYFTGDKVIAFGQNKIQYLERLDDQVKVRGHRIELNEINERIKFLEPSIDVVTVVRDKPEPHLCSFYINPTTKVIDIREILLSLKHLMPEYKVPQTLILLHEFPLTISGKIDKKALANIPLTALISNNSSAYSENNHTPNPNDLVQKLCDLIESDFDIKIEDISVPLTMYGFNSLSFNRLSLLIEQNFSSSIPPHHFYRVGDVSAIAEELQIRRNNNTAPHFLQKKRLSKRIAIIGYDCLMPGEADPFIFWESLIKNENLVISHNRTWLNSNEKAGYLHNIEQFDRHFFKLSPLECARMDPRQRLLLQCAWKTVEHAGYAASALQGSTLACYVAATGLDYVMAQNRMGLSIHPYSLSGNALTMLANRISYFFDWHGPSITIDTACSGSLSALIRACEHLFLTENNMAFVGAVNLIADNYLNEALDANNMLSKQFHCASFSEQADGYVRGEGVIGFLLKPLEDAEKAGDRIHAVIESVAENHGGRAQSLTAPNQYAQTALFLQAYDEELAKKLTYIETHGTGTKLGDPIEIDAIKAFEKERITANHPCIKLGSIKSNIGHLEAAAGLASLLKVVLAQNYKLLPANLHFTNLNPLINFENSCLEILDKNSIWDTSDELVAGISSFGFGGSNAHIVVSNSYKIKPKSIEKNQESLIILSAKTEPALWARINNLKMDLEQLPDIDLQNVAYTLAMGRDHFNEHRWAVIVKSKEELLEALEMKLKNQQFTKENGTSNLSPFYNAFLGKKEIDWGELYDQSFQRVSLRPYKFDEQNYWFTKLLSQEQAGSLDAGIIINKKNNHEYEIIISSKHVFFTDHQVFKHKVLPGVAHIEIAMMVLKKHGIKEPLMITENFRWIKPVKTKSENIKLVAIIESNDDGYQIVFQNTDNEVCSSGSFKNKSSLVQSYALATEIETMLMGKLTKKYSSSEIYKNFSLLGIDYGPYFQCIEYVEVYENISKAKLSVKSKESLVSILDCALQSGMAISIDSNQRGLMPFALGAMILIKNIEPLREVMVYTKKLSPYRTHLMICDCFNNPLLSFIDLGIKSANFVESTEISE